MKTLLERFVNNIDLGSAQNEENAKPNPILDIINNPQQYILTAKVTDNGIIIKITEDRLEPTDI
jgi:hypothetical protein